MHILDTIIPRLFSYSVCSSVLSFVEIYAFPFRFSNLRFLMFIAIRQVLAKTFPYFDCVNLQSDRIRAKNFTHRRSYASHTQAKKRQKSAIKNEIRNERRLATFAAADSKLRPG